MKVRDKDGGRERLTDGKGKVMESIRGRGRLAEGESYREGK